MENHFKFNNIMMTGVMTSRRRIFHTLLGLTIVFILLALFSRYDYLDRLQPLIPDAKLRSQHDAIQYFNINYPRSNVTLFEIEDILHKQRRLIEKKMKNSTFPGRKFGVDDTNLSDFIMEKGGKPLRSIILTSWRSGSTFLGEAITAHPATYYHYEPLLDFGIVQVRGPPLAEKALQNIEKLLKCNYTNMEHYLDYGKDHDYLFYHNTPLWKQCKLKESICLDPRFLSLFCQLFPFQSMKIVRLRLNLTEKLLAQESLGIKIVLLVRDPRGIMQSRKNREWCPTEPDCFNPALLCADMVSDFKAAMIFSRKYPNNFRIARYEDLSLNSFEYVKDLYKFYGLDFHPKVEKFLNSHTGHNYGGVSSTFRDSKNVSINWRENLDFDEVKKIQDVCEIAMQFWGYVPAKNSTHQKYFIPITNFSLDQFNGNDI